MSQKYSLIKLSYLDPLVLTPDTPWRGRGIFKLSWRSFRTQ